MNPNWQNPGNGAQPIPYNMIATVQGGGYQVPTATGTQYFPTVTGVINGIQQSGLFAPNNSMMVQNGQHFMVRQNLTRPPPNTSTQPPQIYQPAMTGPPPQAQIFPTHVPPPPITQPGVQPQQHHHGMPPPQHLQHHNMPPMQSFILAGGGMAIGGMPGGNLAGAALTSASYDENIQSFMENGGGSGAASRSASASFSNYGAPPNMVAIESMMVQQQQEPQQHMMHGGQQMAPVGGMPMHAQHHPPQSHSGGYSGEPQNFYGASGHNDQQMIAMQRYSEHPPPTNFLQSANNVNGGEFPPTSHIPSAPPLSAMATSQCSTVVSPPTMGMGMGSSACTGDGRESSSELENNVVVSVANSETRAPSGRNEVEQNSQVFANAAQTQQQKSQDDQFSRTSPLNADAPAFHPTSQSEVENSDQRSNQSPNNNNDASWRTTTGTNSKMQFTSNKHSRHPPSDSYYNASKNLQICYYCKLSGKPEKEYMDHCTMKDDKFVLCRQLKTDGCKECGVKGENAHPEILCPKRQEAQKEFIRFAEEFPVGKGRHGAAGGGGGGGGNFNKAAYSNNQHNGSHRGGGGQPRGPKKF